MKNYWKLLILLTAVSIAAFLIGTQIYGLSKDFDSFYKSEEINARMSEQIWQNSTWWGKTKIVAKNTPDYIGELLGFKQDYKTPFFGEIAKLKDFFKYAGVGFLAGLWMYLINFIISVYYRITPRNRSSISMATRKKASDTHKGSWLYLIGGNFWKVIIIAMVYGIIMLIPIVTTVIKVITFEALMPNSWMIRSFIIAFYIGFGPAAIEQYYRYRLRMQYYKHLMNVKYGVKTAKALSTG